MKKPFTQEDFLHWLKSLGYFEEGHLSCGMSRQDFTLKNKCWESSVEWALENHSTAQFLESLTKSISKENILSLDESKMYFNISI